MIAQAPRARRLTPARIVRGLYARARLYADGIGSIVPKLVYGNSAGFKNNFVAIRGLAKLRAAFRGDRAALAAEPYAAYARDLETNGYLAPTAAAADDVRLVTAATRRLLEDPHSSVPSPNGASVFVVDPIQRVPDLVRLLTAQTRRIIAAYYGCAFRIQSVRVWRNHHVPGVDNERDDQFSNTFHNDGYPVTGLRVFVLLSDGVTRETGALRLHDRATSAGIMRSLGQFHRQVVPPRVRRRLLNPQTLRFFEGDSGDICICNTQHCLHAASVPKAGTFRDMLQFEIYPAAGALASDPELLAAIPPDDEVRAMAQARAAH